MKIFRCPGCQADLFIENTACSCGLAVAYDPSADAFVSGQPFCANRDRIGCNWTCAPGQTLCESCRMTSVHPDLAVAGNDLLWAKAEAAKRHTLIGLMRWGFGLGPEVIIPRNRKIRVHTGHAAAFAQRLPRRAGPVAANAVAAGAEGLVADESLCRRIIGNSQTATAGGILNKQIGLAAGTLEDLHRFGFLEAVGVGACLEGGDAFRRARRFSIQRVMANRLTTGQVRTAGFRKLSCDLAQGAAQPFFQNRMVEGHGEDLRHA